VAAFLVFLGSWLSGYFIVATDAWMQHPTGYRIGANGAIELASFWDLLLNKWALWQYAHTMLGAAQTGCFVMAVSVLLSTDKTRSNLRAHFRACGCYCRHRCSNLAALPLRRHAREIGCEQPAADSGGDGRTFRITRRSAAGYPRAARRGQEKTRQPTGSPQHAEFLTYRQWRANIKGLSDFPQTEWPDQIPLLYYSYHVMVGLGTIFIAVMALAALLQWRGKLYDSRWMLWILMVCVPFPYIANTAGWMTAELGRQLG